MMENTPLEYNKFVIQLQGGGFKVNPNIAGKVASFWVVNKEQKVRSIFAFAISLLDLMENEGDSERKIIDSAISQIKEYIDSNKIKDLEEYTFKYVSHQFTVDENANWWTKSLKVLFKL